jgi:hypothetical protein
VSVHDEATIMVRGEAAMNDRKSGDPLAQFQQFVTEWERRLDGLANRVMGTDEFTRSLNALQNAQLGMQRTFMEGMANYLNGLNMPSREDVTELGERLHAIEQRLTHMEGTLARLAGDNAAPVARPAGPRRTRQPPSRGTAAGGTGS